MNKLLTRDTLICLLLSSGGVHVSFPPSCSSSVTLPFTWVKGSVAFPRGFPTRLSRKAFPHTQVFLGFPYGSKCGKESACNAGDLGSIPGLGRYPGEAKGYPLQYSGLENSMEYSPWGHKESGMTERLPLSLSIEQILSPSVCLSI